MSSQEPVKRVFLRFKSSCVDFDENELINTFLTYAKIRTNDEFHHFVHYQTRDNDPFYIILDINYARLLHPELSNLPHEVYRVTFKDDQP